MLEVMAQLGPLVPVVDLLVRQGQLAPWEILALKVTKVIPEIRVTKATWVPLVHRVIREPWAILGLLVILDPKAPLVKLDPLD